VNGIDPQIHGGKPEGLMRALRNTLRQPGDTTTVPEMLNAYQAVRRRVPELRRNAGSRSLFESAAFRDLRLAAILESQQVIGQQVSL
jgi:hypothetical protein